MAMIQVTVGTNTKREKILIDSSRSPKQAFAEKNIDYSTAMVNLDGSTLSAAEMNKSFDDLGITESAMLIAVTKVNNAA